MDANRVFSGKDIEVLCNNGNGKEPPCVEAQEVQPQSEDEVVQVIVPKEKVEEQPIEEQVSSMGRAAMSFFQRVSKNAPRFLETPSYKEAHNLFVEAKGRAQADQFEEAKNGFQQSVYRLTELYAEWLKTQLHRMAERCQDYHEKTNKAFSEWENGRKKKAEELRTRNLLPWFFPNRLESQYLQACENVRRWSAKRSIDRLEIPDPVSR